MIVKKKWKRDTSGMDRSPAIELQHLLEKAEKEWLEVLNKFLKVKVFSEVWKMATESESDEQGAISLFNEIKQFKIV